MKEIEDIINAYDSAKAAGTSCILATVVHVEGSSYRGAGARMLVDEHGLMTGAISGGCLEGDALLKALHAHSQGKNKLVTYDTGDEEDAIIGAQLGCDGVIQVLFEPIDYHNPLNPIELLRTAVGKRASQIVVTFFDLKNKRGPQHGTSLYLDHDFNQKGLSVDGIVLPQLKQDAITVRDSGQSLFRTYRHGGNQTDVFIEIFKPAISLIIVGAGNDARVMAQMAETLGWGITVVDGRPSHANQERFVSSCQVIVSRPEAVLDNLNIDERTAFVLMTHNYHYDLGVLKSLVSESSVPYIGILGPKKKYVRMLEDMKKEGIVFSEEQMRRVYAPVGLEIGAETPPEIGLSILAEIQAVFTEKPASFLRDKEGPIHQKVNRQFEIVEV